MQVWASFGHMPDYVFGEQLLFFCLHAAGIIMQAQALAQYKPSGFMQGLILHPALARTLIAASALLFFRPWLRGHYDVLFWRLPLPEAWQCNPVHIMVALLRGKVAAGDALCKAGGWFLVGLGLLRAKGALALRQEDAEG